MMLINKNDLQKTKLAPKELMRPNEYLQWKNVVVRVNFHIEVFLSIKLLFTGDCNIR